LTVARVVDGVGEFVVPVELDIYEEKILACEVESDSRVHHVVIAIN
jgi:RPA family protein